MLFTVKIIKLANSLISSDKSARLIDKNKDLQTKNH